MTLASRDLQQADEVITQPIYLIELGFTPLLYLSSGRDVVWNGKYWPSAPIQVSSIDNTAVGGQTVSLQIANHNRQYGALVLSQVAQDRSVKIWLAYDKPVVTPVLFADGVMDGASVGAHVNINVISKSTAYGSTPRILCGPPLMNHLPDSGTVLKAGNVTITIRSR